MGVDRALGGFAIPMTWFQALNPLLVITMTPLLLLHWRRQADAGRDTPPARKMAIGAIVATAYLLLAAVSTSVGAERASWLWLFLFFVILTLGAGLRMVGDRKSVPESGGSTPGTDLAYPLGSYAALDLNADIYNKNWTVRVYVKNLTDERLSDDQPSQ